MAKGWIVLSSDEQRLVASTIGLDPIRFWDTESRNELLNLQGHPGSMLIAPRFLSDDNTLAAIEVNFESGERNVRLWRAPTWEEINAAEAREKAGQP
jgi:WD40 repeat protein